MCCCFPESVLSPEVLPVGSLTLLTVIVTVGYLGLLGLFCYGMASLTTLPVSECLRPPHTLATLAQDQGYIPRRKVLATSLPKGRSALLEMGEAGPHLYLLFYLLSLALLSHLKLPPVTCVLGTVSSKQ